MKRFDDGQFIQAVSTGALVKQHQIITREVGISERSGVPRTPKNHKLWLTGIFTRARILLNTLKRVCAIHHRFELEPELAAA
jgi:hypothetical protein